MQGFEVVRGQHSQGGVTAARVVEASDPLEHRAGQVDPRGPVLPVQQFALHGGPERFDEGVVDAGSDAPHGSEEASGAQPVTEHPGRVLGASIRVDDGAIRAELPAGHLLGVDDQFGADVVGDRPAHDLATERVDDRAAVDPSVRRAMLGDVGEPDPVRRFGGEPPLDQVVMGGHVRAMPPLAAVADPVDAGAAHQPCHASPVNA